MKKKQYSPPVFVGQNIYIRPTYVVSVPEFYYENRYSSQSFIDNKKNLAVNKHKGILSKKAISNLKNAINWLVCSASPKRVYCRRSNKSFNFKVSFITLTLPDTHEPVGNKDFQNKLLNPFLVYCRKYFGLKNYVWKLELQQNGKIHCHITSDRFLHWRDLRTTWNRLLRNCGYLAKFAADHGHSDPNSTDIHSVANVRNVAAYLAKYLSKSPGETGLITGRIWGCSYELSKANKTSVHIPADQCREELKCLMHKEINFEVMYVQKTEFDTPRSVGEIFFLNTTKWQKIISGTIRQVYEAARSAISSGDQFFTDIEVAAL